MFSHPFTEMPIVVATCKGSAKDVIINAKISNVTINQFTLTVTAIDASSNIVGIPNYPVVVNWIAVSK